ncbi:hypothetical protein [Bradyrhizobium sp. STM 3562]|uniref:hypothetical protein n=1 Tax=Bradyrhizobium sp. STM 3562 TaxID=578924 RepID=UPI0038911700
MTANENRNEMIMTRPARVKIGSRFFSLVGNDCSAMTHNNTQTENIQGRATLNATEELAG